MSAPASQQTKMPPQWTPWQFLYNCKKKRARLNQVTSGFVEGQTTTWQLPQAGMAETLYLLVELTIVVAGTVSGGTWATLPYPAPDSIVSRMRLRNTPSTLLRSLTGWNWKTWTRYRWNKDIVGANPGIPMSANMQDVLGNNLSSGAIVPGANISAGTYKLRIAQPIPVAYNHAGDQCMLILSTPGQYFYLDVDWGTIATGVGATGGTSTLINGLTGSGLSVTVTVNRLEATIEYWVVPEGAENLIAPFTSAYMSVTDAVIPITQNGHQIIIPPPNDQYTMILLELVNNAAHVLANQVSNIQWNFGGNINDTTDDLDTLAVRQFWLSGLTPMDGVIPWDLGVRRGDYNKRDDFDAFNNQSVTGLQLEFDLNTGGITAPAQGNIIYESVRPYGTG